jgi:hypothetical protein
MEHNAGKPANAHTHVFFHTTGTAVTTAQLTTLAALVSAQWNTNLKPLTPAGIALTLVEVEDLGHPDTVPGVWAGNIAGTNAQPAQPAEVATLINFAIARRYRGGKPRVYLPMGPSASLSSPIQWNGAWVTSVNGGWAAFITGIISGSGSGAAVDKQVSVSYFNDKAPRATPVIDDVLSATASQVPASQRRRMGR